MLLQSNENIHVKTIWQCTLCWLEEMALYEPGMVMGPYAGPSWNRTLESLLQSPNSPVSSALMVYVGTHAAVIRIPQCIFRTK